jgi:hypothetical protein
MSAADLRPVMTFSAIALAASDHGALELGEGADHLHHHLPAGVVVSMFSVMERKPARSRRAAP